MAERKCGELLRQSAERGERATSETGNPSFQASKPTTLDDIGITRDQSSRYQQLAAMPDAHFETAAIAIDTIDPCEYCGQWSFIKLRSQAREDE